MDTGAVDISTIRRICKRKLKTEQYRSIEYIPSQLLGKETYRKYIERYIMCHKVFPIMREEEFFSNKLYGTVIKFKNYIDNIDTVASFYKVYVPD